ncbi:MAG: hypothetical protein AAGB01_11345, partial [Cyanobacteria bacterium P01_F01_bin.42]
AMEEINDACVFGMPDDDWGEIAIAAFVSLDLSLTPERLTRRLKALLASYKCPKVWWRLPTIPRNLQGKVDFQRLKREWLLTL